MLEALSSPRRTSSHPRIVNEIRFGYNRNRSERLQFNSDQNLSAKYGIPGIPFTTNNGGLPSFSISDLTSFGSSEYQPTVEVQNVYQIVDSLELGKGPPFTQVWSGVEAAVSTSPFCSLPYPAGSLASTEMQRAIRTTFRIPGSALRTFCWALFREAAPLRRSSMTNFNSPAMPSICKMISKFRVSSR